MNHTYFKLLLDYNRACKAIDEIYEDFAKAYGLSETDFWILYALAEKGEQKTQKDLCEWWSASKQTINSSLKRLQKEGIVELSNSETNKKSKYISLTDKGTELVESIIQPVMEAEIDAFEVMGERDTQEYLRLHKIYTAVLERTIKNIKKEGK